ncbi:alphaN-acetylglucosamine transferase [Trichoderma velutinum]
MYATLGSYAYVFYATQDIYACSAAVNIFRLQNVFETEHRIFVIVSSDVSPDYLSVLNAIGATVYIETPPPLAEGSISYYQGCLLKLLAFKIYEQDSSLRRVLVLDSDQLIVRNVDAIFRMPSAELAAPSAYWLENSGITTTCMLIELSSGLWERVQEAITSILPDEYDMDIINRIFQKEIYRLPGSYVTLNSHWEDRNVPIWFAANHSSAFPTDSSAQPASDDDLEELYHQTDILHFTAVGKPWMWDVATVKTLRPEAHPLLLEQWGKWRSTALSICPKGLISEI